MGGVDMNQDRSSRSPVGRFVRPLVGVGTVLIVSASAVAVAAAGGAVNPDAATVASSAPATNEPSVVETSAVVATEAPAVASTEAPVVATSEAPVVESSAPPATVATAVESSTVESTPAAAATQGHPLVGAWLLTSESDPEGPSTMLGSFSSDGIYQEADSDGTVGIGAWEATGPNTAGLTFMAQFEIGEDAVASVTVRGSIEVAPDGQTLTAEFTLELAGVEGAPAGQFGPGTVTGTRISVEPMGTPAGTLEDLFAGFAEGTEMAEGTAVAAPPTTG
jgi:hypothetical protein